MSEFIFKFVQYISSIRKMSGINNNILAVLDSYSLDSSEEIAKAIAEDFRKRRVEKNISREQIASLSKVPLSTVARFEQKGLISFESLIKLAMALGYTPEIKNIFASSKFDTMEELDLIRQKSKNKRAYVKTHSHKKVRN